MLVYLLCPSVEQKPKSIFEHFIGGGSGCFFKGPFIHWDFPLHLILLWIISKQLPLYNYSLNFPLIVYPKSLSLNNINLIRRPVWWLIIHLSNVEPKNIREVGECTEGSEHCDKLLVFHQFLSKSFHCYISLCIFFFAWDKAKLKLSSNWLYIPVFFPTHSLIEASVKLTILLLQHPEF
jgi:hypothetical protein